MGSVGKGRVRGARNRRLVQVKTNGAQWSDVAEEEFFDHLAATCNVSASAAAVGFSTFTVYRQRRMRPDFAARWQAAIEQGYARLEAALIEAANDSLQDVAFDPDRPIPRMTIDQAMNVLRAHRNTVSGNGRGGPGRHARPRPLEEVRGSILKKVEAIRNSTRLECDRAQRDRSAAEGRDGDEA